MNIIFTILKLFKMSVLSNIQADVMSVRSLLFLYTILIIITIKTITRTLPLCLHTIIFKSHFSDTHPHHLEPLELLKKENCLKLRNSPSRQHTLPYHSWKEGYRGHVWAGLGGPMGRVWLCGARLNGPRFSPYSNSQGCNGSQTGPPDRCT